MEKSENGINCRCRFLVVCGALACTCYVAAGNYRQWQERPLVTSLKVYLQSPGTSHDACNLVARTPTSQCGAPPSPA